jgi:catechol-2,3-dioxygenase
LGDGSFLAFFEVPDSPFEFKAQHDYDLHIALEVDPATQAEMFARGKAAGIETRGVADHGFIRSIYFRDPNGYVIELAAPTDSATDYAVEAETKAHDRLARWQRTKPGAT